LGVGVTFGVKGGQMSYTPKATLPQSCQAVLAQLRRKESIALNKHISRTNVVVKSLVVASLRR